MGNIKLRKAITAKKTISYDKKPDLWAQKCECCGLIFKMDKYCNDQLAPAVMSGTFSKCAGDSGNMFFATVCSFACADKIFKGGWKDLPEYKPYKRVKAILIRVSLGLTSLVKTEENLIKEWQDG